jgi:endonuclease-3
VNELLSQEYGQRVWRPHHDPVSELVLTILSQHTADTNSKRAFETLRAGFPSWQEVRDAPQDQIANAIRSAGLANIKARRIKETLEAVSREAGLDLGFLCKLDLASAKAWLQSLQGVGPKTAACVLLFSLGQPALPVDTHVHRLSRRLGLIEGRVTAEAAHELLEQSLPPSSVYSFHMNMVTHGRRVCKAQAPRCGLCVLHNECDYSRSLPH